MKKHLRVGIQLILEATGPGLTETKGDTGWVGQRKKSQAQPPERIFKLDGMMF